MIIIGRPVDTTELEKYTPAGVPLPPIYPGSIISRCTVCTADVYVGPRQQEVLKAHPDDAEVQCPICGVIKAEHEPIMRGLDNPYRPGADEPQGVFCPGCQKPAAMFGGGMAWCGNDACHVLNWNPEKTLDELAANVHQIRRIPPAFGGDDPR